MNPAQSLSFLVLLYLLSVPHMVISIQTSNPHPHHHHHHHHKPCGSSRASHKKGLCYRRWCKKAQHTKLCKSIVEADHRECLKMNPEGVVLILIKAARAYKRRTVTFIRRSLKNATDVGVRQGLENCLLGYKSVGKLLDISLCDLSDTDSRSDALDALSQVEDEVTYDCQWYQPSPFPPTLKEMFKRVNRFSAILLTAQEIMELF